jgi:hypothetical protein
MLMVDKFLDIEKIFMSLKIRYRLKEKEVNDYVYELSNDQAGIIFMFERYEEGFSVFLKDINAGIQYPIWKIFDAKGKPEIAIDFSLVKRERNLLWHESFLSNYLQKELSGDFSDLQNYT